MGGTGQPLYQVPSRLFIDTRFRRRWAAYLKVVRRAGVVRVLLMVGSCEWPPVRALELEVTPDGKTSVATGPELDLEMRKFLDGELLPLLLDRERT